MGLLYATSFWVELEDVDVVSVELEWTEGKEALGGLDLGWAKPPTDAELLHSEHGTQQIENTDLPRYGK